MNLNEKLSIMEAILFACGEPVELKKLAEVCETSKDAVIDLMKILNDRYDANKSALQAVRLGDCYQLCTRKEYAEYIRAVMESKRSTPLSNAALESLTIVAYNQPVTKSFVDNVRGVDSSSIINSLVDKELLEDAGRLDVPGKPVVFRTTNNFLRCFGLNSLEDLPPLHENYEDKPLFKGNNLLAKVSE